MRTTCGALILLLGWTLSSQPARGDGPPVFSDGFESETLCWWSAVTPSESACARKIGSPCAEDAQCPNQGFCVLGFCSAVCGAGGVGDCNDPAVSAGPGEGAFGGVYACWQLATSSASICWPNGSGEPCAEATDCPRPDESCIGGVCRYPSAPAGLAARQQLRCGAGSDCYASESCAYVANLDLDDVRSDGGCLWRGDPPHLRLPQGASCSRDIQCGSGVCDGGVCLEMCRESADCAAGARCVVEGRVAGGWWHEFADEYLGLCEPWAGSAAACSARADCAGGESCSPYLTLLDDDTHVGVSFACRALANPAGGATGTGCGSDAECASGRCTRNLVTGHGYCTSDCPGGDADCGGATECRMLLYLAGDPSRTTDDLRVGRCVETSLGSVCEASPACTTCSVDADCAPAQGVLCVRPTAGSPTGICRDRFGRCADPCRNDCPANPCPADTTCETVALSWDNIVSYCRPAGGGCVRADVGRALQLEHGICGDAEYPLGGGEPQSQDDLCYFYGELDDAVLPASSELFLCGEGPCAAISCPEIPLEEGGAVGTACRTVYGADGLALVPDQCAPEAAFTPP